MTPKTPKTPKTSGPGPADGNGYTGHVEPGGGVDVRELPAVTIRKMAVSAMHNNVYLLTCVVSGEQLLIDAADEPDRILELVAAGGRGLGTIVTTHQHWDHVRALAAVVAATGATTVAGADDAEALPAPVDVLVGQGDAVTFGAITLRVVHLRGHTPGGLALAYDDPDGHTHLFTGDSLFPGGVGNTKNEGQHFGTLIDDVTQRVFEVYDDDTWFYPGHGDDSTIGAERPHLDAWRSRGW
ncbi:MAG: MBL fold metallo-hydrolase [Terracoccus sp.]